MKKISLMIATAFLMSTVTFAQEAKDAKQAPKQEKKTEKKEEKKGENKGKHKGEHKKAEEKKK